MELKLEFCVGFSQRCFDRLGRLPAREDEAWVLAAFGQWDESLTARDGDRDACDEGDGAGLVEAVHSG